MEGERGEPVQHPGGSKVLKERVAKMVALQREEQPIPLGWRIQGRGRGYASQ